MPQDAAVLREARPVFWGANCNSLAVLPDRQSLSETVNMAEEPILADIGPELKLLALK